MPAKSPNYRAELRKLVKACDEHGASWPVSDLRPLFIAAARARTLLAQPEPEGLTDKELLKAWDTVEYEALPDSDVVQNLRNVIAADRARCGRPAPRPPADGEASERLPELRQRFAATLNGARCLSDRPVGNVELADRLLDDVLAWSTPTPQPPADGEVAELVAWLLNEADADDRCDHTHWLDGAQMRRIADLLQHQHPQPVPVSERLPGAKDMTEDGEVWIEDPGQHYPLADTGDYDWEPHKWILRPIGKFDAKNGLRWLPAHALPVPTSEEVEA